MWKRTVAPSVLPVTLSELKAHVGQDLSVDDPILTACLAAAIGRFDLQNGIIGRALITQTWQFTTSGADSCGRIVIDRGPLLAVTSVERLLSGTYATVSDATYVLREESSFRAYLRPVTGGTWPTTDSDEEAFRLTLSLGFGPASSDVPQEIRSAILLFAAHLYRNREATTDFPMAPLPGGVEALISPFRIPAF